MSGMRNSLGSGTTGDHAFNMARDHEGRIARIEQSLADPNYWIVPQKQQRQDPLEDQLRDVVALANRYGCFDAADWIQDRLGEDEDHARELLSRPIRQEETG